MVVAADHLRRSSWLRGEQRRGQIDRGENQEERGVGIYARYDVFKLTAGFKVPKFRARIESGMQRTSRPAQATPP
jgi:hypothetical protein